MAHVTAVQGGRRKDCPERGVPERGVPPLPHVRQSLPAPSHGGAGAQGSEHSKVPQPGGLLPPWESSMCLAAILVIPAMGKRSPAERQLLAPEIIPKNPCIGFLPTQPPLLHHSANLFP